jgi:transposase-like protein
MMSMDGTIELPQVKYLNNIVEQDHRAIKRQVRPMLGFKSFWSASVTLAGIESQRPANRTAAPDAIVPWLPTGLC